MEPQWPLQTHTRISAIPGQPAYLILPIRLSSVPNASNHIGLSSFASVSSSKNQTHFWILPKGILAVQNHRLILDITQDCFYQSSCDRTCCGERFGLVWSSLVLVWFDLVWSGLVWSGLVVNVHVGHYSASILCFLHVVLLMILSA